MTNATLTIAGAFAGLILAIQTATIAEANGKAFDFQQYVDRYAGSATSDGGSIKVDVEKLAKDLPKLDNLKLNGSDKFCDEDKSGDEAADDWRAIARRYACPK